MHRLMMIGERHFIQKEISSLHVMSEQCPDLTDAVRLTPGQNITISHIQELVLQRRTTAIQNEDLHRSPLPTSSPVTAEAATSFMLLRTATKIR